MRPLQGIESRKSFHPFEYWVGLAIGFIWGAIAVGVLWILSK